MVLVAALMLFQGAGLPPDPALDVRVDAVLRAHRVPVQLKQLTKEWGVAMRCAPELDTRMLILHVTDRPRREIMEKLAQAAGARWVKSQYAYELLPAQKPDTLNERTQAIATRQQELSKQLAAVRMEEATLRPLLVKELEGWAEMYSEDEHAMSEEDSLADEGAPMRFQPSSRLAMRLLAGLSPRELATLPEGERAVYSSAPTEWQRAFDLPLQELFAEFEREQALAHRIAAPLLPSLPAEARKDVEGEFQIQPTRKLLLSVTAGETGEGSVEAILALYDTNGKVWNSGYALLEAPEEEEGERVSLREAMTGDASEPIPFGPVAAHVLRSQQQRRSGALPVPASEDLKALMSDPLERPRLSFGFTDAAFAVAESGDLDLVLCPSDGSPLPEVRLVLQVPPRMESFRAMVQASVRTGSSKVQDGWWILEDASPGSASLVEIERERNFLRAFTEGRLGFWELVERPGATADLAAYLTAIDMRASVFANLQGSLYDGLREILLGLDAAQRADLMEFGQLRIRLTDEQRHTILATLAYFGYGGDTLRDEVTECALIEGVLRLKREPKHWALPPDDSNPRELRPASPFTLAAAHLMSEEPEMAGRMVKYDRYRLVTGIEWKVSLDLGMNEPFDGSVFTLESVAGEAIPLDQFPKSFYDQFKKDIEDIKKDIAQEEGGGE